jgi:hypothetical protein
VRYYAAVVILLALAISVFATSSSDELPAGNICKRSVESSSLPVDAQGLISWALGKNDSSYWVHRNAAGFLGENPQQGLVAKFTREGAEVRHHNLRWALEIRGYGYGNSLHPLRAVAPQAKGQPGRVGGAYEIV